MPRALTTRPQPQGRVVTARRSRTYVVPIVREIPRPAEPDALNIPPW